MDGIGQGIPIVIIALLDFQNDDIPVAFCADMYPAILRSSNNAVEEFLNDRPDSPFFGTGQKVGRYFIPEHSFATRGD